MARWASLTLAIGCLFHGGIAHSAQKKGTKSEVRDPEGQTFRLAPMAVAPRTVTVPLAKDVHLAFDTELLRGYTAWQGPGLNLYGTPFRASKTPFYCTHSGETLFEGIADFPWRQGNIVNEVVGEMPEWARYRGLSDKGESVRFLFEFEINGQTVPVVETTRTEQSGGGVTIIKRIEIGPSSQELSYFPYAILGGEATNTENVVSFSPSNGDAYSVSVVGDVRLSLNSENVSFQSWLWKPVKNDCERTTVKQEGRLHRAVVSVPAHKKPIVFEVVAVFGGTKVPSGNKNALSSANLNWHQSKSKGVSRPAKVVGLDKGIASRVSGNEYFKVEHFQLPKELGLQVTGLDFFENGDMAVCTWRGDVYIFENASGPVENVKVRRFARGLCEPGGLTIIGGVVHVVQKVELTRLVDTDGDGLADWFDCLNQDWGSTGNYHDFSFGPVVDQNGDYYVYRTGNRGVWELPYMGWAIKISKDGKTVDPISSGLRSPNGYGSYKGDVFMADNQGNWMGTCTLNHIKKGRFYGYPSSWPAPKKDYQGRAERDAPAIWFPYKLSASTSDMKVATDERFGPFKGQLIVGDWKNANLMRVQMEKVNGEWQGTVWPLTKGFWSGVNRFEFGPDGKLYVGGCKNSAWAALGPYEASLDRVSWTGNVPFEVSEVKALSDGFELSFTQKIDNETASDPLSYDVLQYRYDYHQKYGSPEIDHDGKLNSKTTLDVTKVEVSKDRKSVRIKVEGLKEGFVTVIRPLDVENDEGDYLWNDEFYYTLNSLPKK